MSDTLGNRNSTILFLLSCNQVQIISREGSSVRLRLLPVARSYARQCIVTFSSVQRSAHHSGRRSPDKTCAQATWSQNPTVERRRTSKVARNGQRVRARRPATRGDRSSLLRATRSVLEVGTAYARASVCVCGLASKRGCTDSFRVADTGVVRCKVLPLLFEAIKPVI